MFFTVAQEYYAPLAPPGIEVRFISKEKGKGMFAKRAFKKGELIFEEKPLISMQEAANKVHSFYQKHLKLFFFF
jgi:SET domain-containing protein